MTKLSFYGTSWISKVVYDTETREMTIFAKNKTYTCVDVDLELYEQFESADSKGTFFNENIKGQFSHEWFQ